MKTSTRALLWLIVAIGCTAWVYQLTIIGDYSTTKFVATLPVTFALPVKLTYLALAAIIGDYPKPWK